MSRAVVEEWLARTLDSPSSSPQGRCSQPPNRKREPEVDLSNTQNKRICGTDRKMSEEGSVVSNNTIPGKSRLILVPTPPSSKRGTEGKRSPSPTRKLLALIKDAKPPIHISQPGNAVMQPTTVSSLRSHLSKDIGIGIIPKVLEVRFC